MSFAVKQSENTDTSTNRQPEGAALSSGPDDAECERCHLPLSGWTEPTDCRYCDPLCPVFGTHGHLWKEDAAIEAYDATRSDPKPRPTRFPIGANGLCTICYREVCEHTTEATP